MLAGLDWAWVGLGLGRLGWLGWASRAGWPGRRGLGCRWAWAWSDLGLGWPGLGWAGLAGRLAGSLLTREAVHMGKRCES